MGKSDVSGSTKLTQMDWVGVFLNTGTWILGVFLLAHICQQVSCTFMTAKRRLFPVQILKSSTIVLPCAELPQFRAIVSCGERRFMWCP